MTRPPPGAYDLLVTATDQAGNTASDRVRFTILPEGSEDPDGADTDDGTGDATSTGGLPSDHGCRVAGAPPDLALLALLLLRRRRRPLVSPARPR